MPHKRKPTKSPVFLERVAQEKQAIQQVTREKYAHISIDLSSDFQSDPPDSDLLTRKYTDKRGKRTRLSAPVHYTSTTHTEARGKEQSKKNIPVRDLRHKIQIRTLLLDSRRQKKMDNANDRLEKFIWYPPEKTYQVHGTSKQPKQRVFSTGSTAHKSAITQAILRKQYVESLEWDGF